MLDRAHELHRAIACFAEQEILFVQTNAVFARASAANGQGAVNQGVVHGFGLLAFFGRLGIDQIADMKITIAHMANEEEGDTAFFDIGHGIEQCISQF